MSIRNQRHRKLYNFQGLAKYTDYAKTHHISHNNNYTARVFSHQTNSQNYLINDFEMTSIDHQILQDGIKYKSQRNLFETQLKFKKQELKTYKQEQQNIQQYFEDLKRAYLQQMNKSTSIKSLQSFIKTDYQKNLQNSQLEKHLIQGQQKKVSLIKDNIEVVSDKIELLSDRVQKMREKQMKIQNKLKTIKKQKQNYLSSRQLLQKQHILATQRIFLQRNLQDQKNKQSIIAFQMKSYQTYLKRQFINLQRAEIQLNKLQQSQTKISQIESILQAKMEKINQQNNSLQNYLEKQLDQKINNQKWLAYLNETLEKLKILHQQIIKSQIQEKRLPQNKEVFSKKSINVKSQNDTILQQRNLNIDNSVQNQYDSIAAKQTIKNIRRNSNTQGRKCITQQII